MYKTMTIGLDLAKNIFAVVVLDAAGKERHRRMLRRGQVLAFLAKQSTCVVAMEACAGSHYWGRQIQLLGHRVVLLPPQHVKGYQRGQKNDYNDALAIAEACQHQKIRPVAIKSLEQQDEQCLHSIRRSLTTEKVRLSNQLRALLGEYGLVVSKGDAPLRQYLVQLLGRTDNALTVRVRQYLARQYARFVALEQELAWYERELRQRVKQDEVCQRLQAVPGIGPVVSSTLRHWMGDGKQFHTGREASAALGVVPRQHSSGGHQRLGAITKQGDAYVRSQVVHGARAVVSRAKGKTDELSCWIQRLEARRGRNKAVVALANKIIRIAWVMIARGEQYRAPQALSSPGS